MQYDDLDELSGFEFGFAWAGIVQTFREASERPLAAVGARRSETSGNILERTRQVALSADWMAMRSN